jgi:hypothetical protein
MLKMDPIIRDFFSGFSLIYVICFILLVQSIVQNSFVNVSPHLNNNGLISCFKEEVAAGKKPMEVDPIKFLLNSSAEGSYLGGNGFNAYRIGPGDSSGDAGDCSSTNVKF